MKILSAAEMQACDRLTIEKYGITSSQLMHKASSAVADFALQHFPSAQRITILCGRGNNGGDGLVAANLLAHAGRHVTAVLLGSPGGLKGDAAEAWRNFTAGKPPSGPEGPTRATVIITVPGELLDHNELLDTDLIIDAIVGTGFQPPLRDLPLAALNWLLVINPKAPILAVDLPSGWNADSTSTIAEAPAFPADAVITFTAPKPAHLFGLLTRNYAQPIIVAPIGSPAEPIVSALNQHWSGSSKAITEKPRPTDSNKGMYGHVLVIGGSEGKSGAPGMASLAALRMGAGLVTAAVSPSVLPLVAALAPELMTHALAVDQDEQVGQQNGQVVQGGQISPANLEPARLEKLLKGITVLAIGPGLGTTPEATEFALSLLERCRLPAVADADALNSISAQRERLPAIADGRTLVLTPHPGEMARLTGLTTKQVQANRVEIARDFATRYKLTLVLKGARTLIAHADGSLAVNTTGNPAMAKGGSGDLLTGMIASLLAQHPDDPNRAVEAAVYLHGLAADITVQDKGISAGIGSDQHTLLATDSLQNLHKAFHFQPQALSGYCWVQGMS